MIKLFLSLRLLQTAKTNQGMEFRGNSQILQMPANNWHRFLIDASAVSRQIAKRFEIKVQEGRKEQFGSDQQSYDASKHIWYWWIAKELGPGRISQKGKERFWEQIKGRNQWEIEAGNFEKVKWNSF